MTQEEIDNIKNSEPSFVDNYTGITSFENSKEDFESERRFARIVANTVCDMEDNAPSTRTDFFEKIKEESKKDNCILIGKMIEKFVDMYVKQYSLDDKKCTLMMMCVAEYKKESKKRETEQENKELVDSVLSVMKPVLARIVTQKKERVYDFCSLYKDMDGV